MPMKPVTPHPSSVVSTTKPCQPPVGAATVSPRRAVRLAPSLSTTLNRPPMKATPAEIASCPVPQLPPGTTLRLKQNISMTLPESQTERSNRDSFTKDPVHGFCWGDHPLVTPAQRLALQEMVIHHKDSFAYSLADLPGYKGPNGEFEIKLTTEDSTANGT